MNMNSDGIAIHKDRRFVLKSVAKSWNKNIFKWISITVIMLSFIQIFMLGTLFTCTSDLEYNGNKYPETSKSVSKFQCFPLFTMSIYNSAKSHISKNTKSQNSEDVHIQHDVLGHFQKIANFLILFANDFNYNTAETTTIQQTSNAKSSLFESSFTNEYITTTNETTSNHDEIQYDISFCGYCKKNSDDTKPLINITKNDQNNIPHKTGKYDYCANLVDCNRVSGLNIINVILYDFGVQFAKKLGHKDPKSLGSSLITIFNTLIKNVAKSNTKENVKYDTKKNKNGGPPRLLNNSKLKNPSLIAGAKKLWSVQLISRTMVLFINGVFLMQIFNVVLLIVLQIKHLETLEKQFVLICLLSLQLISIAVLGCMTFVLLGYYLLVSYYITKPLETHVHLGVSFNTGFYIFLVLMLLQVITTFTLVLMKKKKLQKKLHCKC